MNNSLEFVRPVISLDAAHLRSEFKGTLYIASSTLTGANDAFLIGFMIAAGNEDRRTWVRMQTYLKEAFPIISHQGQGDERCANISQQGQGEGVDDASLPKTSASNRATPFLFVSDRDKGLKEAVKEVFPANVEFSCAQHIRANVLQRFGKNASKYVMAIAKTYSARYVEILMEKTKK
jgi:Transposase, Mutator family